MSPISQVFKTLKFSDYLDGCFGSLISAKDFNHVTKLTIERASPRILHAHHQVIRKTNQVIPWNYRASHVNWFASNVSTPGNPHVQIVQKNRNCIFPFPHDQVICFCIKIWLAGRIRSSC